MQYLGRHVDERLDWALSSMPAVSVEGMRGVGKTTTASRLASTTVLLDRPNEAMAFTADPFAAVEGHNEPLLLDEWQSAPAVWDAVRRSVDSNSSPGRFILCGSSRSAAQSARHTGAGRIASLEMRPMTLSERQGRTPDVRLADLFDHGVEALPGPSVTYGSGAQRAMTERAGLPGLLPLDDRAHEAQVDSYLRSVLAADLQLIDGVARNVTRLWRYFTAYASCVGTNTAQSTIFNAAGISNATAADYHDVLSRVGLVVELPAFWANSLKSLAKAPKRHLVDAAFAAVPFAPAQRDHGRLWENVVVAQLRAVAEATLDRPSLTHLRTASGRQEVDLIIADAAGRLIAVEAKSSPIVEPSDTRHLRWLRDALGSDESVTDGEPRNTVSCGLVVHPGERCVQLGDGIAAVPLAALA